MLGRYVCLDLFLVRVLRSISYWTLLFFLCFISLCLYLFPNFRFISLMSYEPERCLSVKLFVWGSTPLGTFSWHDVWKDKMRKRGIDYRNTLMRVCILHTWRVSVNVKTTSNEKKKRNKWY